MAYENLNYLSSVSVKYSSFDLSLINSFKSLSVVNSILDLGRLNVFRTLSVLAPIERDIYKPVSRGGETVNIAGRNERPILSINCLRGIGVYQNLSELLALDETKRQKGFVCSILNYDTNNQNSTSGKRKLLVHTASSKESWLLSDFKEVLSGYKPTQTKNETDIYVNSAFGSNSFGTGKESHPYQSIEHAISTINPNILTETINIHLSAHTYTFTDELINLIYTSSVYNTVFVGSVDKQSINVVHSAGNSFTGLAGNVDEYKGLFVSNDVDSFPVIGNTLDTLNVAAFSGTFTSLDTLQTNIVFSGTSNNGYLSFKDCNINLSNDLSVAYISNCIVSGTGNIFSDSIKGCSITNIPIHSDGLKVSGSYFNNTKIEVVGSVIVDNCVVENITDYFIFSDGISMPHVFIRSLFLSTKDVIKSNRYTAIINILGGSVYEHVFTEKCNNLHVILNNIEGSKVFADGNTTFHSIIDNINITGVNMLQSENVQTQVDTIEIELSDNITIVECHRVEHGVYIGNGIIRVIKSSQGNHIQTEIKMHHINDTDVGVDALDLLNISIVSNNLQISTTNITYTVTRL